VAEPLKSRLKIKGSTEFLVSSIWAYHKRLNRTIAEKYWYYREKPRV